MILMLRRLRVHRYVSLYFFHWLGPLLGGCFALWIAWISLLRYSGLPAYSWNVRM